jgi:hypothetical protein
MELNIHGNIIIQFPIVTQHYIFSRKINKQISDIQIDEVQNFSRFSSIRKRFRINMVVTNNMSTYESYLVTLDSLSEKNNLISGIIPVAIQLVTSEKFHNYPESFHNNLVRLV